MAETGGPTTWSGLYFQGRVAVYAMVLMLHERALNLPNPISSVRVEAPALVDDVLITREDGGRIFQSVKESISRSTLRKSPWAKLWEANRSLVLLEDFLPDRDRIEIVFPVKEPLTRNLDELTQRSRSLRQPEEILARVTSTQREILDEIQTLLGADLRQVTEILRCTYIRFVGDSLMLYQSLCALLYPVSPFDDAIRTHLLDGLGQLVFEKAKGRAEFDFESIRRWLLSRDVPVDHFLRRAFTILKEASGEMSRSEAQHFFRGFPASWRCIRDEVPIDRTCYVNGKRKSILEEAVNLKEAHQLRTYFIVGPAGVGKSTIAKQLAFDLSKNGHVVGWLDSYPRRLHKDLALEFRALTAEGTRVHLFADFGAPGSRIGSTGRTDTVLNELAEFVRAVGGGPRLTLYLTADSNHYEQVRPDIEEILGGSPECIRVPLNLDGAELGHLIDALRKWDALERLTLKSDAEILRIFQTKLHKILLVALIEATNGQTEKEGFRNILRREYDALPESSQPLYPMAAMTHAYNVEIPTRLLLSALQNIPGGVVVPLERMRRELSGVLMIRGGGYWVSTRHQVIARTLCESLSVWDADSAENGLWLPLFRALLKTIKEEEETEATFIQEAALGRIISVLNSTLQTLVDDLVNDKTFRNLSPYTRSIMLNSVARTFQSRGDLASAIQCAEKSINEVWPNEQNGALIILMYCYAATRNTLRAESIAKRIVERAENPRHLLHAVRVLSRWGSESDSGMKILEAHDKVLRKLAGYQDAKAEALRASVAFQDFSMDGDPRPHAQWVHRRLELGQIESEAAIERLRTILEQDPNIHRAFTDLCHLLLLENNITLILEVCDSLLSTKDEDAASSPVNFETQAMVLATKGWATFKQRGAKAEEKVLQLLKQSITLKENNPWSHNWLGLVLHILHPHTGSAENELRAALKYNRKTPPFYRNLAKVIVETNTSPFSRSRNAEVIMLSEAGLALCPPESYWNWGGLRAEMDGFLYYAKSLQVQGIADGADLVGDILETYV